jgi:hypothetical protein
MYETDIITILIYVLWAISYSVMIYTRGRDVNNVSNYFTYMWLVADWINMNSCLIIFDKDISNVLVIESILFVIFDMVCIIQLMYVTQERKKVIMEVVLTIVLCSVLLKVLQNDMGVLPVYIWIGQVTLMASRFPSIYKYYTLKSIEHYMEVAVMVLTTIMANSMGLVLITINMIKRDNREYLPWVIVKSVIVTLDIIIIVIVLYKKKKTIGDIC